MTGLLAKYSFLFQRIHTTVYFVHISDMVFCILYFMLLLLSLDTYLQLRTCSPVYEKKKHVVLLKTPFGKMSSKKTFLQNELDVQESKQKVGCSPLKTLSVYIKYYIVHTEA